jgi:hypothetical protein
VRNTAFTLLVFALTIAGWTHAAPYWSHAFLIGRNFESRWALDPTFLVLIWGFDFLLSLVAGFVLSLLVKGKRPLWWVAALGFGFMVLRIRFTKVWISPDADWGIYFEDYGRYLVPVVGTLAGGYLAQLVRSLQHSTAPPNNRWRGP